MNPAANKPVLSKFAEALIQKGRTPHVFEAGTHFGLGDLPAGRIAVRVATKAEQDRAIAGAHDYAKQVADKTGADRDPDLLEDAKSAFIAFEVCRDPDDAKQPLFLSPRDMLERLSSEQIAILVNLANEVRWKEAGRPEITSDAVMALSEACAKHAGDDIPEAILARFNREFLTHAFVIQSAELALVKARLAELESPPPEAA